MQFDVGMEAVTEVHKKINNTEILCESFSITIKGLAWTKFM